MVRMYKKTWKKSFIVALLWYVRDALIYFLPFKKLSTSLIRLLYGMEPRFFFLVHPRRYQDIFIGVPFLGFLKYLIRKKTAAKIFSMLPPFVLSRVTNESGIHGMVIGYLVMPELMIANQKWALEKSKNMIDFCTKISNKGAIIGLGGWWPMVTRRGLSLKDYAKARGTIVTSGHCGTLLSMYLMIKKISQVVPLDLHNMAVAIIGSGKMGASVAKALYGEVGLLTLIDINEVKLKKLSAELKGKPTRIDEICLGKNAVRLREVFKKHHVGVCAASNIRNLMNFRDIPEGFAVIDDSRPEALPRDPKHQKLIFEGGLLKIKGIKTDYDYGFGMDENVFGCLAEAYILALDRNHDLKSTSGDVDEENFKKMEKFCVANGIEVGDFKSCDEIIPYQQIKEIINARILKSEIKVENSAIRKG